MSRFDRAVDRKNAEISHAASKAEAEKREKELEIERRKAQYFPVIRKNWLQFQEVIPKLNYTSEIEREVFTKFLFISYSRKKRIKWFVDYSKNDINYGFDSKGNFYSRGNYTCYHAKIKSIEELIFGMLPWKEYRHTEDWSETKRKWYKAIRSEIINDNADEAVAKYFESLI